MLEHSVMLVLSTALVAEAVAAECSMEPKATHESGVVVYAATDGVASLYYAADMDVNTDGAARSYHPDDPHGRSLAFNNIANAIYNIYDATGAEIGCTPRRGACYQRYIETFEAARDANYAPQGAPRVTTNDMIPWRQDETLGWATPCRIAGGAFDGYFVSQTSLIVDRTRGDCDQARYLDSFSYNAVVIPKRAIWRSQGVVTDEGDLVVLRDSDNGRIAFAINGDRGPSKIIGEGSIALTAMLSGATLDGDETYTEIKALHRDNVQFVTFPKDDIRRLTGGPFTQADIDREGARLFAAWGGAARLDACAALE